MPLSTTIEKRADDALARAQKVLKDARAPTDRVPGDRALQLLTGDAVFGVTEDAAGRDCYVRFGDGVGFDGARPNQDVFAFVTRDATGAVTSVRKAEHWAKSSALRDALKMDLAEGQAVTVGRGCGLREDVEVFREIAVLTYVDVRLEAGLAKQDFEVVDPRRQLAGEAGVHNHALSRDAGRTGMDGPHDHIFLIERDVPDPDTGETVLSGMMLISDRDGVHEHTFQGGDETGDLTSPHAHRIVFDAGGRATLANLLGIENLEDQVLVELTTEVDGEHKHEVQVDTTAVDGVHRHVLKLPDGTEVTSMNGDEFNMFFNMPAEGETMSAKAVRAATLRALAVSRAPAVPVPAAVPAAPDDVAKALDVDYVARAPGRGALTKRGARLVPTSTSAQVRDVITKQGHVHSIPGGGVTGAAEGEGHTHSLPDGGTTGPPQGDGDDHVHSLPDGGTTGPPREEVESSAVDKQAPTDDMTEDQLRTAREARSEQFGIEVIEGSALTFPADFPRTLDDYGDPVNLKFPIDTVERARNARVRFKQNAMETYEEERSRAVVHERIVRAELEFGVVPSFDPDDPLDQLLPADLREELSKTIKGLRRSVRLLKSDDEEERFVFGVVLVPDEVDAQGDTYSKEEVRKAAHGYMQHFGGVLKLMHQGQPVEAARVVETYLTKVEETHSGEAFPVGTWLMGSKIDRSDAGNTLWVDVKGGEYTGYSIGGTALREALAPAGA